ncbi:Protein CBG11808 [Caenorhabditis briggsae]|uniref:Protein CBG11805 n=1 Tax=Caenorhabditis briggsae TaxID=6238 RepID=G2J6Q3_CAEBR|nr:Protein CBG11805 [Caenorhabditis briggsae]XP_045094674.1 Protein CBG11808 [Caenorhabditis briggsae]CAP30901.2 Protein CBG11805 [Caenorhabditis briggsae]CAP30903.2 Protein CBG11808 [Caenorhabditis briggsae]
MDKPINIGPDGSRVQTPDDQHHDAENMYSRIRKRRANETCESYLNDVQDHDADNIYERIYKRPSRGITKSSTTNDKRHNKKRPAVNRSEWTWIPGHLPEIPQTRFPKGVPQGPKRIPSYTVEDLDKEWSRKELPSRQSGRYAQYDPESYFERELLKETNWKKFLKEEKAARKSQ